ncbi:HNH endonuclease [Gordonia sp. ABSL11-1]|uniref:HNH endonuclease n=1 Tax=Gordonia sp. ABSL11-1 TaxID=3053924 RepID=UPI0025722185|nr:HNH endonuclease [Gordonia sp. ABSL11-1]MDL9944591.1 HNH endonuclease [Gordonia sp. ABSL11-1]
MPNLQLLTRDSVLGAIAECDALGRDAFLERNTFKEARDYFLIHDGRAYDSKAIAGVAYGAVGGARLASSDFTGGLAVAEVLRKLGFHVTGVTDWTLSELLLAAALLEDNGWRRTLRAHEEAVIELSRILRDRNPELAISPTFRSPGSIQRKLEDLRTSRSDYGGAATRGGRLTEQVALAFERDPRRMMELARTVQSDSSFAVPDPEGAAPVDTAAEGLVHAVEGRLVRRLVATRERDPQLRAAKLRAVRSAGKPIACEVCAFNFGKMYGAHGNGYIQVHHVMPLHASGEVTTTLDDLVLLCANCHVMIHQGTGWKTPDELRQLVESGQR